MNFNGKNQMALVSFKNIHIWPSYSQKMTRIPIFGNTFLGHNPAISGSIGMKFFMGTQETIIYRLLVRNPSYDAYF